VRKHKLRNWKTAAVLTVAVAAVAVWAATSLAASHAATVKVAIMTDCKGAFAFGYEQDIGGAQAAFAKWAHGKAVNKSKPSAGMTGINVNGTPIKIVGYGCGNDTVPLAVTETKRLMEKLGADVMIGPLSGDEAVYVANYAKSHPTKTFINGTAGSQDPTMQIAPKNQFRYHGDGAQWNAGAGELAYKLNGWRKAAIIEDDYSFGWTSAAGFIADFCAVGGQIVKRVFPPLNTTDYAPFVRQLPPPNQVDGYFSTVGGTGTSAMLKAYEQAYGKINPKQWIGNLFFTFLGADKTVGPKVIGSYVGGFGTAAGLKTPVANAYRAVIHATYPSQDAAADSGFVYNYYNAAWALVQGLQKSGGAVGAKLVAALPRTIRPGFQVSNGGVLHLDSRRQAIQDQYQIQMIRKPDGSAAPAVVAFVPNVDQSFGGLFKPSSPPPGRVQPPCKKQKLPWTGKIRVIKNGKITNQVYK
jgi:branched-chain amino acid transport system substrate-binding protein